MSIFVHFCDGLMACEGLSDGFFPALCLFPISLLTAAFFVCGGTTCFSGICVTSLDSPEAPPPPEWKFAHGARRSPMI